MNTNYNMGVVVIATQMDMLQRIKCTVDSCTFNDNKACSASSIEVNLNSVLTDPNSEFAAELGTFDVHSSEATMCRTYKARNQA